MCACGCDDCRKHGTIFGRKVNGKCKIKEKNGEKDCATS